VAGSDPLTVAFGRLVQPRPGPWHLAGFSARCWLTLSKAGVRGILVFGIASARWLGLFSRSRGLIRPFANIGTTQFNKKTVGASWASMVVGGPDSRKKFLKKGLGGRLFLALASGTGGAAAPACGRGRGDGPGIVESWRQAPF